MTTRRNLRHRQRARRESAIARLHFSIGHKKVQAALLHVAIQKEEDGILREDLKQLQLENSISQKRAELTLANTERNL